MTPGAASQTPSPESFAESVAGELESIRARGLWRELRALDGVRGARVTRRGRELLNFSSNDYLGLAGSDELRSALLAGIEKHGAGAGASRLVCGSHAAHCELEEEIARFKRAEAALSFSSGYAVALGTIPALMGRDDVVILDKLCHASLVDAARLSGATIRVFPHNHLEKLERLVRAARESALRARVLVVTESIFSMDGDAAALREIADIKDRHGAWLLLDEAHAVGVLGPQGRGLAAALGLEQRVDLHMGTLSKAAGLSGGYLAASRAVVDLLVNKARSLIYSTAPPPALAHAAREALRVIQSETGERLRERLRGNVEAWERHREDEKPSVSFPAAIHPVIVGNESRAMDLSARLLDAGFLVPAIRFPTVARGSARLRITFSAAHEGGQVEALAVSLRRAMAEMA
jgi:8-amino-7-oxononanoate synthase